MTREQRKAALQERIVLTDSGSFLMVDRDKSLPFSNLLTSSLHPQCGHRLTMMCQFFVDDFGARSLFLSNLKLKQLKR